MTVEGRREAGSAEPCENGHSEEPADEQGRDDERGEAADHLRDVPVGSGCTEIWEHLAEQREDDG